MSGEVFLLNNFSGAELMSEELIFEKAHLQLSNS